MQKQATPIVVVMFMWIATAAAGTSTTTVKDHKLATFACAVSDGTPACPRHRIRG